MNNSLITITKENYTTVTNSIVESITDIITNPCTKDNGKPCNKFRRHSQGCVLPYDKTKDCSTCYTFAFDPGILRGNNKNINAPKCPSFIKSNTDNIKIHLPVIADCKYKGNWICDCGNGGNPNRSRYNCDHPTEYVDICTNEFVSNEYTTCGNTCNGYVPTNLFRNITKKHALSIIQQPINTYSYPTGWQKFPGVKEAHYQLVDDLLENLRNTSLTNYISNKERCIVTSAGGNYLPGVYINVLLLREKLECNLPYEVYYLGSKGEDKDIEKYRKLLESYNVTFHNIDTHPNRKSRRIVNGFESKLFSVMASNYREVLYLDADVYCCQDPTKLFDNKDYRKRSGGIYYPDLNITDKWTKWEHWNVVKHSWSTTTESGVYLINKEKCWSIIKLIEHFDDRSDFYYGLENGGHGDKESHRVAWAKFNVEPTMFNKTAVWIEPAFVHGDEDNNPVFIHRVRSKFSLGNKSNNKGNGSFITNQNGINIKGNLPLEAMAFKYLDKLKQELNRL